MCGEAEIMRTREAGAHGRKCHSGRRNLCFLGCFLFGFFGGEEGGVKCYYSEITA